MAKALEGGTEFQDALLEQRGAMVRLVVLITHHVFYSADVNGN